MESEPIRRVHEARLTAKRQLGTDPRIPLPGRACGGLLRMWGGVATGRPACQRATRVLRCAPVLRMTRRPSLRSESSYGPCGPAWTGASRPSTTSRRTREEQSARGPDVRGSRGEAEPANAGVFLAGAASNWGHPYPHLFQETHVLTSGSSTPPTPILKAESSSLLKPTIRPRANASRTASSLLWMAVNGPAPISAAWAVIVLSPTTKGHLLFVGAPKVVGFKKYARSVVRSPGDA